MEGTPLTPTTPAGPARGPAAAAPQAPAAAPAAPRVAPDRLVRAARVPEGMVAGNTVLVPDGRGKYANFSGIDQMTDPARFGYACADTCMAMLINFHLHGGREVHDLPKVTAVTHRTKLYSSPLVLTAYAEANGLEASVVNRATLKQVKAMIDQGLPVQVQLDYSEPHDGLGLRRGTQGWHNVVVTGYGRDADGTAQIEVMDPGGGARKTMTEAEFTRRWARLNFGGFQTGLDNLMTVYKPKGDPRPLPSDGRGSFTDAGMAALVPADAVTQITNGWSRHSPGQVAVGLWNLIGAGLPAAQAALGRNVAEGGEQHVRSGAGKLGTGVWATVAGLAEVAAGAQAFVLGKSNELAGSVMTRLNAMSPRVGQLMPALPALPALPAVPAPVAMGARQLAAIASPPLALAPKAIALAQAVPVPTARQVGRLADGALAVTLPAPVARAVSSGARTVGNQIGRGLAAAGRWLGL